MTDIPYFDPDDPDLEREEIPHPEPRSERTIARRSAVQVLYEYDLSQHPIGSILNYHLSENVPHDAWKEFMVTLAQGVIEHNDVIDVLIQQYAEERPVNQLSTIDRNILRIAFFEIIFDQTTPVIVSIDEAVGLARIFGTEASLRFVNGVLGTLLPDLPTICEQLNLPVPELPDLPDLLDNS
jgi:N utilization substance protein B